MISKNQAVLIEGALLCVQFVLFFVGFSALA